jgi:tetratricopeptide (TPR) repeat protein
VTGDIPFPTYLPREEEQQIRQQVARARQSRRSRVVLLYGSGGVGKTELLRALARTPTVADRAAWLEPIDVDDPEYWLLSNLERRVVEQLDPAGRYFASYLEFLRRLPRYPTRRLDYETVVSHLARIKGEFAQCYRRFVEETGQTVVVSLDTVEAVLGTGLLVTMAQWMKGLPGTLFILSGRPPPAGAPDAIRAMLADPHHPLDVHVVHLAGLSWPAALRYLDTGTVAAALSAAERRALVHLTQGHPLWLALTLDYLVARGMPEEAEQPAEYIERNAPYQGPPTPAGARLLDGFRRRLVTPYREVDFWHEATKRLAVVRRNVNQYIWRQLMVDRDLPPGVRDWDAAWERLLRTPWIRSRANRRFVTLHDALADELAQRVIPLHDQDQHWRRRQWQRAVAVYGELATRVGGRLDGRHAAWSESVGTTRVDAGRRGRDEALLIDEAARLNAEKRELDQIRAARLYYLLLSSPPEGCREFLRLNAVAEREHDILFQTLIVTEMRRFLPGTTGSAVPEELIREAVAGFRRWLSQTSPGSHLEVGLSIAAYLIANGQAPAAIDMLDGLPVAQAPPAHRYRRSNLRGNACMRTPGRVREGGTDFEAALGEARALPEPERRKAVAEALKELGFYYRNEGLWQKADEAYRRAHDEIAATMSPSSPAEDREEMASIQTNWAYVKGLRGNHLEGQSLVESAISVRRRLGKRREEGISLSVYGELLRFEAQFERAWACYLEAEHTFESLADWSWLGMIYQEQAMCLFQAGQAGRQLAGVLDAAKEAEERIVSALNICRERSVRGYPSALNRAGRIFGGREHDRALGYLVEGISQAHALADGWFWSANLIEYVELCWQAWQRTGVQEYRDRITERAAEIDQVLAEYTFPDLDGRWHLLRGHLAVHDMLESRRWDLSDDALRHYSAGFRLVAEGYVASHGAAAIPAEFEKFKRLFQQLPQDIRERWESSLRRSWSDSILLLARLSELY